MASSLFKLKQQQKKPLADIWFLVFGFSRRLIQWKEHTMLILAKNLLYAYERTFVRRSARKLKADANEIMTFY